MAEMRLDDVYYSREYGEEYALAVTVRFLWDLLAEQDLRLSISHKKMPTLEEHVDFVRRARYRDWQVVIADDERVGAVYLTRDNEIGIRILRRFQRLGYGEWAVRAIMAKHPGVDRFLANINPKNANSVALFNKLGFDILQMTLQGKPRNGVCPKCGADPEMGYGLAGGGMGPYSYCPEHGIIEKFQDPEMSDGPVVSSAGTGIHSSSHDDDDAEVGLG